MADLKSSANENSNSDSNENESQQIYVLEAQELAKYRLRHLKQSFDEYVSSLESYTQRHYLIVAVCCVVIFFGFIIVILKLEGKESLLYNFQAIQSFSASLISGGSLAVYGSSILFSRDKKEEADESKNEPKNEAIQLCTERELGRKIDKTTKKLRDKKNSLEVAKAWQSIWLSIASVAVLILVGFDFFSLLPDIKYFDIGLDLFISLIGSYLLYGISVLFAVLTNPREKSEEYHFSLFFIVIPCALSTGLMEGNEGIIRIICCAFAPCIFKKDGHWIKEVYLSPEERLEVMYLLRGLNPNIFETDLGVKKFCEELIENHNENVNESSPLIPKTTFIEKVNYIESDANRKVLNEYFYLGEALTECLKNQIDPNQPQRKPKD
jgi:hypothetical protein